MKQIIVYGKNVFNAIVEKRIKIYSIFVLESSSCLEIIKKKNLKYKICERKELDNLTSKGNHQGVALLIDEFTYTPLDEMIRDSKKDGTILILDGIEDPNNLGAIIRIADAYALDGIIIAKDRQALVTSAVYHVSTGALLYTKIALVANLANSIAKLKENGFWVVGAEANNNLSFNKVDYKDTKIALVVGSEGKGIGNLVSQKCDYLVNIQMFGHVNSLNVSVATGILINEIVQKKRE
ncbi:MAG: 23S rRNA (guanosine(2251)-2'-O)-methyltransferase RlmB [Bacillales bacterium]|jgi:23S rRNA (guanosine2251-2'-O)-methyltransferase|nr:23S rRNA (guanosine(2251)-2'-O)-methyltransferase RlmB [Bacillales bacterium]